MKPVSTQTLFLTFDDGPHPTVTPWVLDELAKFNTRATFFCVGENAKTYPDVMDRIRKEGHRVGNHTFNHIKGWQTETEGYVENTHLAAPFTSATLFRPPYGRIRRKQSTLLKQAGYDIVMWSQLSGDYMQDLNIRRSLRYLIRNARPGNIVVFHDSAKAEKQLKQILPEYLKKMSQLGYSFEAL